MRATPATTDRSFAVPLRGTGAQDDSRAARRPKPRRASRATYAATTLALLLAATVLGPGCARREAPPLAPTASPPPPPTATGAPGAGKIKVTAYINVTSGCQAETVSLLQKLATDCAQLVDFELVDFGSPRGERRWRSDGMECMAIVFNGSPFVRFPGKDGTPKTVQFAMPQSILWTHEELEQAFAALKANKLELLTEEQARQALAPQTAHIKTAVRSRDDGAELLINGKPVLKITARDNGTSPSSRAQAARTALNQWTRTPIEPTQLLIAPAEGEGAYAILAAGTPIIRVTPQDARAAKLPGAKQLAVEWLKAIRGSLAEAIAGAPTPAKAEPPKPGGS